MADQESKEVEQEVELTEAEDAALAEQATRDTEDQLLKDAFERKRDPETGRYVKKEETAQAAETTESAETPETPVEAPEPAKEVPKERKPEDEEVLPSWRAREINEERRKVQEENEQMRVQLARFQAMQAQADRAAQPQQKPDPLVDPNAYWQAIMQQTAHDRAMDRLNMNFDMYEEIHGEKFTKAYDAVLSEAQRGNTAVRDYLISQRNPGRAIMQWYRQNETLHTVGNDPEAYRAKVKEELLNDPEFVAQMQERMRASAMGGGQQKPNTVVKLPPTLARATGSSAMESMVGPNPNTDGSESALFAYAMRPRGG